MTLSELFRIVDQSNRAQWHKLAVQTVYGWQWNTPGGNAENLQPRTFESIFVYQEDVDISIAMSANVSDDLFEESWATSFPDRKARMVSVLLRYRGAPVNEWLCVIVDGGRHLMPLPENKGGKFSLPVADLPRARLLFNLNEPMPSHETVDEMLRRAGVSVA